MSDTLTVEGSTAAGPASIDVIDDLAGIAGTHLAALRERRAQARENAQASFAALFAPTSSNGFGVTERFAVAFFVAGLHADGAALAFYEEGLKRSGGPELRRVLAEAVALGRADGPYGRYPEGPLGRESRDGLIFELGATERQVVGPRLAAALEHAHFLVFRPREATPAALQALVEAGWSGAAIVTLSQLVAFLTFQIRAAVGLRAVAAATAGDAPTQSVA